MGRAMGDLFQAVIDVGADALRQRQMAGRITRPWARLPNSDKRKWREHAEAVLQATGTTDLLEALQNIIPRFERAIIECGSDPKFAAAATEMHRAAIAKATGGEHA